MYSPPIFIELNAKLLSELVAYSRRIPTVSFREDSITRQTYMSLRESCVLEAAAVIFKKVFLYEVSVEMCVCVEIGSINESLIMWGFIRRERRGDYK